MDELMTVEVAKKMVELTTTVEDYRKKKKKNSGEAGDG